MNDEIKKVLDGLSPEEYEATMKILNEISQNGDSNTLRDLYDEDYEEIPVDIDEFIENPMYAGKFTGNGTLIYPYWREELRKIFHPDKYGKDNNYVEIVLGGSIG